MLDIPAYTHERRAYSSTLYPTSFTLDSLPSRLAPSSRLPVDVPTRALWLAVVFLRRKKICAGVCYESLERLIGKVINTGIMER